MEKEKIEILLIEDDPAEANLMREMLAETRRWEFSVQHVQSLADGLALLKNRSFDCVLVDLGLPDSHGLETALAVRNQAKLTPIAIVTILDDEELALKALQMDIQDYLIKEEITGTLLVRSIRYAIQRKDISEALRESEQRFASFMLHLPAAAWIKDLHGRYVYANTEAERIFAMPLSEFSGKSDEEFLPPETARQFREDDEQVLTRGGSLRTTELLRQTNGIEHQYIVSKFAVPAPDGQPAHIAGVAFDITERKGAEEALRKSEKKFARIFNSVPALIGISTMEEERYIDVNETALQLLGYRRDEVIGRTAQELNLWEDPSVKARVAQALKEQGTIQNFEVRFRGKNGQIFTGLLSAEFIDFNGNRYRLGLVKDITDRKRAEEEVEQLNTQLAARAAELEDANRELEAFNYTVAHDLRKPLTAVNGYCEVIRELCSDKLDEQCKTYLREAYDGTWRMNQLIDTLLNFSRVTRMEPRRETVDLSGIVRKVTADLQLADPARRATLRIAEGISVNGDAGLLQVVLENLLGNAWKYTGMREEAVIEFGTMEIDGKPVYFVRDNGLGFAQADTDKLFIPFQRLPGTEETKGFGIGLATVDRIIRRHGGRVWAEGEPGKGATFWFTLP
jgi:PAS domain S-box-containing protein